MVLDGEYSYESENQRALPFSVELDQIVDEDRVYRGSTSKLQIMVLP